MTINVQRTSGKANLAHSRFYIHGPGKVGKSTFASGWPYALFCSTERRLEHIKDVSFVYIDSWQTFKEVVKTLRETGYRQRYKTIVVDVLDLVYQHCLQYVKEKKGFEHPSDESYGRGYDQVDTEFKLVFFQLLALPYAIVFISHSTPRDFVTLHGTTTKQMSTLPDRIKRITMPHMGVIGYMCWDVAEVQRNGRAEYIDVPVLKFRGSDAFEAGDGEGMLPEKIYLSKDPRKSFALIQQYYARANQSAR